MQTPQNAQSSHAHLHTYSTNGCLPCQPISHKMKHSFILRKQPKATGVSPIIRDLRVSPDILCASYMYTYSYGLSSIQRVCVCTRACVCVNSPSFLSCIFSFMFSKWAYTFMMYPPVPLLLSPHLSLFTGPGVSGSQIHSHCHCSKDRSCDRVRPRPHHWHLPGVWDYTYGVFTYACVSLSESRQFIIQSILQILECHGFEQVLYQLSHRASSGGWGWIQQLLTY